MCITLFKKNKDTNNLKRCQERSVISNGSKLNPAFMAFILAAWMIQKIWLFPHYNENNIVNGKKRVLKEEVFP